MQTAIATTPSLEGNETRRIRIVHIQLLPLLSGVQRVSLDELARLDPAVFETHLICQSPGEFTVAAEKLGVQCHYAGALQRQINARQDYRAWQQVRQLLEQIQPDIVHTHSSKTGLLGRWAAHRIGVPAIVHTVQGFAFPSAKSIIHRSAFQFCERLAASRCHAIICVNRSDEETAKSTLRAPSDNVFLIPNGIELERFTVTDRIDNREQRKRDLLSLDARPLVLNVGRLWEQKNPELYVRAACELISRGLDCNFALAGDGPLKPKLEGIVRDAGAEERIHFLGWRDDIPDVLPLADLLVLSSNWEGMPLVLLEANACGVPAVATNARGSRDCVIDGKTGLLAQRNDQPDLVAKIQQMMADPDARRTMAENCLAYVREHHNIDDRHRVIVRLYADLLHRASQHELADRILRPID